MNTGVVVTKVAYLVCLILIVFAVILAVHTIKMEGKVSSKIFSTNNIVCNVKFNENFSEGILNTQTWQITREGDFEESTVDVYDVDPGEDVNYRLRLRANTIGTSDDTVKFHGVRSIQKVDFSEGVTISFDLDWNNQSNGCYLTGSIYLCPTATSENPRDEKDWLKFEYVGVPPGKNARSVIATRIDERTTWLYTEDWPEDRNGKKITDQHIQIALDDKTFKIMEEGAEIYASPSHDLTFTSAHIYLQMSSHSNYPAREIYFDNVAVAEDI
ncbi:MAG: hypothetical protein C5S47_06755 [Candidatus Methanogasteraceae archaeon]|nr:MAG: hypothetical protein C5S47_06755 [ANME-2 cluster archaeon]